jgi:hypothetical protein
MSTPSKQSTPLKFKELAPGSRFVGFPMDGDDHGHGGYRKGHYLIIKTKQPVDASGNNAVRLVDGGSLKFTGDEQVLLVL